MSTAGPKPMLTLTFAVFLAACQIAIFLLPALAGTRIKPNFAPLFALAILWLNYALSRRAGASPALGVVLWVAFGIVGFSSLTPTTFALFSFADTPKSQPPIVFGAVGAKKSLAFVYHPGASGFAKKVDSKFLADMAGAGFRGTLYTARPGLALDPTTVAALGLSAPVYTGEIRPALTSYVAATDLRGIKCFVILTGWFASPDIAKADLAKMRRLIEGKGGIFLGAKKFGTFSPPRDEEIASFAREIQGTL